MWLCSKLLLMLLILAPLLEASAAETSSPLPAVETVKADLDVVLGSTFDVMALSREELLQLIADCDRLTPQLAAFPESPRKVYSRRLEMARKLFLFTLENRKPEDP